MSRTKNRAVVEGLLKTTIVDSATGKPTPARVRIRSEAGEYYGAENRLSVGGRDLDVYYKRSAGFEQLFYSPPKFEIALPAGKYNLLIEKGFEYYPWEMDFELSRDQVLNVDVKLKRWVDMRAEGWMSGNYHIHLDRSSPESSAEILEILKAEDLSVAHLLVSQLEGRYREVQPIFGRGGSEYSEGYSVHSGEEYTNDRYGHMAFVGISRLIEPLGTGPRRRLETKADYPANCEMAKEAKRLGGTVFACHGGYGEFPVDLALGVIDGVEVLQGNKWRRVTRQGREMLLAPSWYHALNCGFKIPGTAAPDYFYLTDKIVNLECNYVYTRDDFTPEAWLEGLKRGRAFMTNGPAMMNFTVDGNMMGETLQLEKPGQKVRVSVRIRSLYPMDELEIVRNGVVIREIRNREKKKFVEIEEEIPIYRSSWIAARARGKNPNEIRGYLLVHGNPVYLELYGQPVLVAESVAWWLEKIDALIARTEREAVFDRESQKQEALAIFYKGRRHYEKLLAKCRY